MVCMDQTGLVRHQSALRAPGRSQRARRPKCARDHGRAVGHHHGHGFTCRGPVHRQPWPWPRGWPSGPSIARSRTVNMALLEGHTRGPAATIQRTGSAWPGTRGLRRQGRVRGLGTTTAPGIWVSWHNDCPRVRAWPCIPARASSRHRLPQGHHHLRNSRPRVRRFSRSYGFSMESIASVGSVEAKRNEAGTARSGRRSSAWTRSSYSTAQLAAVRRAQRPRTGSRQHMGVPSVAEASAMLASHGGELIVNKEKTPTVTLAVARSNRA